ncbi:MAG: putative glycosyltransferase [Candidatus Saccharibacteria bacterium]|nr:putative glycosyltransferase [Candidatus Saccharibacteria bacterium]
MHSNKRVLIISCYPIKDPLHGGQKRVAAVVEEYKKVFARVKYVAVFVREHYPVYDHDDIYLTGRWATAALHDHLTSDIRIGNAMVESPDLRRKLEALLRSYKPDIIQVDQCFPYIGLRQIIQDMGIRPKIIYNSQNIETVIKEDVMTIAGAADTDVAEALAIIEEVETDLAQHADLVAAVSKEDGEYYLSLGAKRYVLASNGIATLAHSPAAVAYWHKQFKAQGIDAIASFIGSSHLPNMQGMQQMIGLRLGFFPANTRLVLAGGVGRHLKQYFDYDNMLDSTFWQRAISVGFLSESQLSGLLEVSDVILLPIVKGGGSNLKTAEAILSGKKIVATTFAFRGYESHLTLPNIWIADTPEKFRAAITEALITPLKKRSKSQELQAQTVQWHYSLKQLVEEAVKL